MEACKILIRPIITEKAGDMKEKNKYVFEVDRRTNKIEVKKAIESVYKVTVEKVNISNLKPKPKRIRMNAGYTRRWKKAVVTLKKGEIDLYK